MTDRYPLSRVVRGIGAFAIAATVASGLVAVPAAQPRPPIAIVGARIVDGSGNEPFVGTIVIAGGRISAVGRQVEPPPDADRIDGTGRTVLPGLIDTELPQALVDGSDAARRQGVALAAGITTAAVGDGVSVPAPGSGDPTAPRLLGPAAVDAPARAQALPPTLRDRRNGTITVRLTPEARAGVALVRGDLKARLALGRLVREDGTLDVAALGATGLPPLDVVTALTGGGAWALNLQSDRGLLAPSMRADLLVVTGDPSTSLDALAQVEHVFLGGVAVDRAALLRPPEPTPPTTPPPAPTPTAAAAPPATPPATPPAPAARGRRGARAARTEKPAEAAKPAVTGTPAPIAVPAPAPNAAGAGTATASPEPKPEPATPAPSATVPAATAAAPAAAATRIRDALLDDFERGETTSAIGPGWVGTGSGEGSGATTLIMGRVVKGLRDHALMLSARMGAGREPFARAALKLDPDERPVDVSRFRGLRFDARGEGRYRIVFVTRGVADGRYHESYFSGSPLWTPVSIPFASIGQNGTGQRVPWTGRDVIEIRFEVVRDTGRLGWLELDNVTFY